MFEGRLGGKRQYFPMVDEVSFEEISLHIEESVSHESLQVGTWLCYHRPFLDDPPGPIWFWSVFTFKFSSAPPFPKRKVSRTKETLGVAGLLRVLLGLLDCLSDYVNFRECSSGGTCTRINMDNSEDIPILLHRHDSFSTSNMTQVRASLVEHIMGELLPHNICSMLV